MNLAPEAFSEAIKKLHFFNKRLQICIVFFFFILFYFLLTWWLPYDTHEKVNFFNINDYYNASYISQHFESLDCTYGRPCIYNDEVDFRVIVLTFSRKKSLQKLLEGLDNVEMDGHSAALEIWVDRNKDGRVSLDTLEVADSFQWSKGSTRVTVQRHHSGLYGQWINSWRPRKTTEVALILEDDMSVSPYVYRWLRQVHLEYSERGDFAGASLNGGDQMQAHNTNIAFASNAIAFMYVCVGTWGFSPQPSFWMEFQDWYHDLLNQGRVPLMEPPPSCYGGWCPPPPSHNKSNNPPNTKSQYSVGLLDSFNSLNLNEDKDVFHPYVDGAKPTEWYKQFEKDGVTDTMWEMWFIYFSITHHRFTLYSSLNSAFASPDDLNRYIAASQPPQGGFWGYQASDLCLALNRKEAGLHFKSSSLDTTCLLVSTWLPSFADLPQKLVKFDWDGNVITED